MALTVQDIQIDLRTIQNRVYAGSNECAHVKEDELLYKVLKAISKGDKEPHLLAAEALKVRNIVYVRWYK